MKKICLVDDTPDLLRHMAEFLQMEGYEVWPCRGGADAIERLRHGTPDLLITDLWMPGIDGFMLIKHCKDEARLKLIPVIIFSARPVSDYQDDARQLGVRDFIKKPADLEAILNIVKPILQH